MHRESILAQIERQVYTLGRADGFSGHDLDLAFISMVDPLHRHYCMGWSEGWTAARDMDAFENAQEVVKAATLGRPQREFYGPSVYGSRRFIEVQARLGIAVSSDVITDAFESRSTVAQLLRTADLLLCRNRGVPCNPEQTDRLRALCAMGLLRCMVDKETGEARYRPTDDGQFELDELLRADLRAVADLRG